MMAHPELELGLEAGMEAKLAIDAPLDPLESRASQPRVRTPTTTHSSATSTSTSARQIDINPRRATPTSAMSVGDVHGDVPADANSSNAPATATGTATATTDNDAAAHASGDGESSAASASTERATRCTKRVVRTGRVNCRWLYNQVQAARGMILIDVRPRAVYEEDTIPSAISIPPVPHARELAQVECVLLEDQRHLFSAKKRKLREVVLFGDSIKGNDERMRELTWLRRLEQLIILDGLATCVKILPDGFLTFKYRYPFYTTASVLDNIGRLTRTESGTHSVNYPNEVLENFLFLGNMWHAQSKRVIRHLGITHVVNASLDIENVFANEGVQYLEVKIKDKADADITSYFDACYAFIESAKRMQHGRVLVHCTQGISRSATLVIMYLMRAQQWSLVTAVNFALASRGVVYPNQGFVRALMEDEYRLYHGNSLSEDEVDTLLQHQIPDRPIPLQVQRQQSELHCAQCNKIFGLLEWKHACNYCRKLFCSKCTSIRLAATDQDNEGSPDEAAKARRVCGGCISRLWRINLPRPRKIRYWARSKHLIVNSISSVGKPVCIAYFEGTESQGLMDIIKARFAVQDNQIMDISTEHGEPVRDLAILPDNAVVLISVGKPGEVKEISHARQSRELRPTTRRPQGTDREQDARKQIPSAQHPTEHMRGRFSSDGTLEDWGTMGRSRLIHAGRSNSFQLNASDPTPPGASRAASKTAIIVNAKFSEWWSLSFPGMGVLDREALLHIKNPKLLTDVMLGMSSLACGALTFPEFSARLKDLGYTSAERNLALCMLEKARSRRHANRRTG